MALIPKSPFPDVPQLPGVPQLLRSVRFPAAPPPALGIATAISRLWHAVTAKTQWGIFKANNDNKLVQVLAPDSVLDFSFANEMRVSDYPVQEGSFASYNKVATPFEIALRMSKSGTLADRTAFLDNLDILLASLELYVVLTPEKLYNNCNVTRYEIVRRSSKGAYFLTDVDVYVRQIRQVIPVYSTTAAATANAQNPDAQPAENLGKTQATDPPAGTTFDPSTSLGIHP